ncbi:MAG: hypothetical protein E5V96_03030 [Mesorhizobium sp.]|nr:MAG: hypothetical protein E5V96_03030 [Mesorhizobium sp.]
MKALGREHMARDQIEERHDGEELRRKSTRRVNQNPVPKARYFELSTKLEAPINLAISPGL